MHAPRWLKKLSNKLLDLALPQRDRALKLSVVTSEYFNENAKRADTPNLPQNTYALFNYRDPLVKDVIWELKYGEPDISLNIMKGVFIDEISEILGELAVFENFQNPVLIPVPISKARASSRGYNQAELLCRLVSEIENQETELALGILIKTKDTPPQSKTRSRPERLSNLKNCFSVKESAKVRDRDILVIDDVTTTGATFDECRRALKQAGAKKIVCLALAH